MCSTEGLIKERTPHSYELSLFEEREDGVSLLVVGGWGVLLGVWAVLLLPHSALPHLSPETWAVQAACFPARRRSEAGSIRH